MSSNLPPGVTPSMIPGNSGDDAAWEKLMDDIANDTATHILDTEQARAVWNMGLKQFLKIREIIRVSEFSVGDHVTYVPHHANGDLNHRHVQHGVITSMNDSFAFVRYGDASGSVATPYQLLRKQ